MKLFVTLPALALALAISSSAMAADGAISKAQLSEMGLSGIQMMSDEAAMQVRGMGYSPRFSLSLAFGISYAHLETSDPDVVASQSGYGGSLGSGGAGSLDGYLAVGKYLASGEHGSEAQITKTQIHEEVIPFIGTYKTTNISQLNVAAGGKAKASSL